MRVSSNPSISLKDLAIPQEHVNRAAVSAVVLAGGASSRMGFNKALARIGATEESQGATLIERTIAKAGQLASEIMVVANDPDRYAWLGLPIVPDVYPGTGALGGVYSGLLMTRSKHSLVVACDMPFLSLPLWRYMLSLPRRYDVLIPRLRSQPEPLHAVYSKACLESMRKMLQSGERKIISFLREVRVRFLTEGEIIRFDPEFLSFFNVNTPAELSRAEELWAEMRRGS